MCIELPIVQYVPNEYIIRIIYYIYITDTSQRDSYTTHKQNTLSPSKSAVHHI